MTFFIGRANISEIEHLKAFIFLLIGSELIHLVYEPVLEPPQAPKSIDAQASQKFKSTTDPTDTENSEDSSNQGCNSCKGIPAHPWYIPRKRKFLLVAGSLFSIAGIIILTAVVAFKNGVIDDFNRFRKRYEPITEEDFLGVGGAMKIGRAWMLRKVFKRLFYETFRLHRCWWRMLEIKCVGDKFKMGDRFRMLVTD